MVYFFMALILYEIVKYYNKQKQEKPLPVEPPLMPIDEAIKLLCNPPRIIHFWPTYEELEQRYGHEYNERFQPCHACGKHECPGTCEEASLYLFEQGVLSVPKPDWLIWN